MIKYVAASFIFLIVLFLFLSGTKQIGKSIKTDLKYGTYDDLILNEHEAYFIRNHCEGELKEQECSIKIFKSSKENGYQHWEEMNTSIKSTMYSYNMFDKSDSIYILVDFNETNSLYKMSNEFKDVEKLVSFRRKIDYYTSDGENNYIIVDDWDKETAKKDKLGRLVRDDNATNSVYENAFDETGWNYKGKINRYSWFTFDQNDNKYFLKRLGPNSQGVELHKEFSNDVIYIKMGSISSDTMVIETDDFWFLGKDKEKTILKRYIKGEEKTVEVFSTKCKKFPRRLYKYKDFLVVITSEIDQSMLGGFGGTKANMYISYDNGESWKDYEPIGFYLGAYDFYKDKSFMAFTGLGEVMLIDFDKFKPNGK